MNLPFSFLNFYTLQDIIEVCILSFLMYQLLYFLHTDRQKNLLLPFYAYSFLLCTSYFLYLKSLMILLIFFAPIITVAIILFHQDILQKNFIASRFDKKTEKIIKYDWIEILFKSCLHASLNSKTLNIFIQRKDHIQEFLSPSITINAPINYEFLVYLLNTMPVSSHSCMLIDHEGIIKGVHATWHHIDTAPWQNFTQMVTEKNDALAITCASGTLLFEVINQGKVIEHLSATQALRLINHCLKDTAPNKGVLSHELAIKEHPTQQQVNS